MLDIFSQISPHLPSPAHSSSPPLRLATQRCPSTPNLLRDQPLSDKNVIIGVFVFLVHGPLHRPCRRQRRENGRMVLAAVVEQKKRKEGRNDRTPFSIPFWFPKESPLFV
ncbi:hypothetical protein AAZV13_12G000400 [Glycine max]